MPFSKSVFIVIGVILAILISFIYFYYTSEKDTINYSNNELLITNSIPIEKEKISQIIVHITGQINNPGLVTLNDGARICDAIEAAGGITLEANLDKVNLAYQLSDGQKVYIPNIHDTDDIVYILESAGDNIIVDSSSNILVNINTATQTEFETLSGIGPSLATKILNYRKENGKFSCIEDLKNVSGIGDAKFDGIKDFICVK